MFSFIEFPKKQTKNKTNKKTTKNKNNNNKKNKNKKQQQPKLRGLSSCGSKGTGNIYLHE